MGLDMYLIAERFLVSFNQTKPRPICPVTNMEIRQVDYYMGYWRKQPDLHGFIVKTFAGGTDECQQIDLGVEDLDTIIAAVKAGPMQTTQGFFFGTHDYSKEETARTLDIFEKAKTFLQTKEEGAWRSIHYQASW